MNKLVRVILTIVCSILLLIVIMYLTGVIIEIPNLYIKQTILSSIVFSVLFATSFVLAIIILWLKQTLKSVKYFSLISFLLGIFLLFMTPTINSRFSKRWETSVIVTYLGGDSWGIPATTHYKYDIKNITNHTLHNVKMIFKCEGYDKDGNDVTWKAVFDTHMDIEANNTASIKVMFSSLEKNRYQFMESDLDIMVWK